MYHESLGLLSGYAQYFLVSPCMIHLMVPSPCFTRSIHTCVCVCTEILTTFKQIYLCVVVHAASALGGHPSYPRCLLLGCVRVCLILLRLLYPKTVGDGYIVLSDLLVVLPLFTADHYEVVSVCLV